jgi:hypothetical protein
MGALFKLKKKEQGQKGLALFSQTFVATDIAQ